MATNEIVKVDSLGLGDKILSCPSQNNPNFRQPYECATVYRIDGGQVYLVRPYIHTGDCVYSGNSVIHYIGYEEYKIDITNRNTNEVLMIDKNRQPLR